MLPTKGKNGRSRTQKGNPTSSMEYKGEDLTGINILPLVNSKGEKVNQATVLI